MVAINIGTIDGCRMGDAIGWTSIGVPIGIPIGMSTGMPIGRCMPIGFSPVAAVQLGGGVLGGGQVDGRVGLEEAHRLQPEARDLYWHHGPVLRSRHMGGSKAMPHDGVLANECAILHMTEVCLAHMQTCATIRNCLPR